MNENFLNFILSLAIVIVAAKASGYLSTRFNQPSVLGELLAGIILGPTVLDMLHKWPIFQASTELLPDFLTIIAELGVILLMLLAGLELNVRELLKSGRVAMFAGIMGVIVPLVLGWVTAVLFGINGTSALFIGLTLSATSVSISAQTLLELGLLRSRVGLGLLGAAVFDDVLVVLALSVSFILFGESGGGLINVLLTVGRMAGYLVTAVLLGIWLIPRLVSWVNRLPISQGTIASVLVLTLLFAWAAEVIGGMAAITGAFLVGLFLSQVPFHDRLETGISTLAYSFFVPVFFINIGLEINLRAIHGPDWWFAITLTIIAIVGKILGSGLGAKIGGFSSREAIQLGIGMVSRGEVGLIVASFALLQGLIDQTSFAIMVFMVIMATLFTPPMLRASFTGQGMGQTRSTNTTQPKKP